MKKAELFEWVFIVLLFVPVITMARMRLHQRNLVLFIALGLVCAAAVMVVYFFYRKRTAGNDGGKEAAPGTDEA